MIEKETEGETERPETAWRVSGSTKIGGSGGPGASAYSITSINNNPFLIPGDVHGSNTSINSNPFRSSVHSAAFRTPMPIPSIRNSLTIDGSSAANSRNSRHWNNNTNYEPSISDRSFMSTATIASVSTAHSRSASGSSATSFGTELMSVVDTLSSSVYEVPEGYKRQEVVRRGSSYSNQNLEKRSLPPTPVGSKEEKRSLPPIPPAALLGSPGPEYVDKKRSLPPTPTGQGMQFNGISYMKEDSDSGMEYGYADSIYSINSSALDALSVIDPLDPMDPLEGDVTPRGSPRGSISGASLRSEAHPGWRSYASSLQSYSSSLSASANGRSGMEFAPSIRGGSQYSGSLYSRRSDASSVRTGSSDSRYSGVSVEFAGQPGFVDSRPGSVSGASLASEGFGVYGGDYDEEYEDDGDYGYAQSVSSSVLSGLSVISPGVTPRGSISGGYEGVRNGSGAAMGSYSDAGSSVHSGNGGSNQSGYAGSTRVGNGEGGSTTEGNYAASMRSANSSSTNGKKHTRNLSTMSANSFATALTAASFFDTAADFDPVVGTGLELVSPPATPRASMQSARRNTSVSGASVADYAATRNSHNARGFGNALNATKIVQDYKSPFDPRGASSGVETERDPTTPKPPSRSSTSTATNAGHTTVTTNENHSRQPTAPASNLPAGSQKKHNRTISNMSAKTFATTLTSNSFFSICTSEAEAEAAFAQLFQPNDSTTPRASIELEANPSRQIAELYSPVTPRASLNKSRSNHDFGGILTDYGMLKADAKIGGKIGAGGVSGTWHGRTSSNVTDMTVDSFSTAKAAESRPSTAVNLSVSNPTHKRELSDSSNITITAPQTRNNSTATARTTSTFSSVTSSTRGTISTSGSYSTRGNSLDVGRAPNQTATLDVPPGSLSVRTASSTTLGQQKPDGLPVPPTSQGPLFRGLRSHKSFSSLRRPSSSRSVTPSVTPSITPSITITNTVPNSPPPASSRPPSRGLGIPGLRSSSRPPASPSPSNSTSSSLASPAAVSPTTPGRGRKDKDTNRARGPPPVARSPYQQTTRTSIQICGAEEGNYRRFPLTAGMLYSGTPTSSIYSGSARESFQTYRSMGGESVHSVQSGMTGATGRSGVSGVSAQKKGLQGAGHVVKELFWKGGWKKKER
ncbi:hypothetical protein BZA77DRAFT_349900 [Pyronema omphalodes]|nr:hypothetical protein BZA77DRAFT_349900 [Pyronema omphalodes]